MCKTCNTDCGNYKGIIFKMLLDANELQCEYDLTKAYIIQSSLSDEEKRKALHLLNIAMIPTNSDNLEERVNKMAETFFLAVAFQLKFLANVSDTVTSKLKTEVDKSIKHYLDLHTKDCEAYNCYINEQKEKEAIALYQTTKEKIKTPDDTDDLTFMNILKYILLKPYIYIFLTFAVFSPFLADILKIIFSRF